MRAFGRVAMWAVISIVAVVVLFRLTALRWWKVPADDPYLVASVAPTLRAGDWVLLWRLTPPSPGSLTLCPEPKQNFASTLKGFDASTILLRTDFLYNTPQSVS